VQEIAIAVAFSLQLGHLYDFCNELWLIEMNIVVARRRDDQSAADDSLARAVAR
jgi:hypothetical protein